MVRGAGIRGGTVYGDSDAQAAYVKDRPVSTGDVCATIYECLGIDPDLLVRDWAGTTAAGAAGGTGDPRDSGVNPTSWSREISVLGGNMIDTATKKPLRVEVSNGGRAYLSD